MPRRLQLDAWSGLSFKRALGDARTPGVSSYEMPVWTGDHARRLQAYQILSAYVSNSAREFLPDDAGRGSYREYGDPGLLRDTILDSVLGEEPQIDVDGADRYDPTRNDNDAEVTAAWELREWLRQTWVDEGGPLKQIEAERDAVGLGDAVFSWGWSSEKNRPRLRVWDPGFYFPVLDDGNEDDFPRRVHIAWEVTEPSTDARTPTTKVRRLTWELVDLPDGETRSYAWADEPSTKTCLYTDATWEIQSGRREVDDLQEGAAVYAVDGDGTELDRVDMQIDFLPVVHLPNTVSVKDHYGQSSLMLVLQILDDLADGDTRLAAAARTVADPQLVMKKATMGGSPMTYSSGQVTEVGDGDLTLLDTSRSLEALLRRLDYLQEKLERNARTPAALLGRVKPSEIPSGIGLAMTFGPMARMIPKMRMARDPKYKVLLRFMWRMSLAGGVADVPSEWFEATMTFGSFMPADKAAVIQQVVQLRAAKIISLETAIDMLRAAGFEVNETSEEIQAMEARDFEGALALFDATQDMSLVADYLQVEIEEPEPAPEPTVPPDPTANPDIPPVPPVA